MAILSLLERLEAFDAGDARVLSLYPDIEPTRVARRAYGIVFEDLVKHERDELAAKDRRREFLAEVTADTGEILTKTLEVARGIERATEARLLDELVEARGWRRATFGLIPTLEALWADAVQKLVVTDGVQVSGSTCANCGRLEPRALDTCPSCGARMQPARDLVPVAMERARAQSGSVEVVHGAAAQRLLDMGEGFAALLRHPA